MQSAATNRWAFSTELSVSRLFETQKLQEKREQSGFKAVCTCTCCSKDVEIYDIRLLQYESLKNKNFLCPDCFEYTGVYPNKIKAEMQCSFCGEKHEETMLEKLQGPKCGMFSNANFVINASKIKYNDAFSPQFLCSKCFYEWLTGAHSICEEYFANNTKANEKHCPCGNEATEYNNMIWGKTYRTSYVKMKLPLPDIHGICKECRDLLAQKYNDYTIQFMNKKSHYKKTVWKGLF